MAESRRYIAVVFPFLITGAPSAIVGISNTVLEPSTATVTVGVPLLISGRTTRAASAVSVSFAGASGSATIAGLNWSIVLIPVTSGSQVCAVNVTDAINGTVGTGALTKTVGAAVTFPAGITPAVWFDGRQQAYSDSAGTLPISAGRLRRINEAAPLTDTWTTPSDAERPYREPEAVRMYLEDTAGGHELTRPAVGGIPRNACTLMFSFVARDQAFAGPQTGLFREDTQLAGIQCGSNLLWINNTSGILFSSLVLAAGFRNTVVVRYTATTVDVWLDANGTITTQSFTGLTIPSTALAGAWRIGLSGAGYLYGSVSQAMAVASSLTNTQCTNLLAWAAAQAHASAYPLDADLITWVGDSITRSTGTTYGNCFASKTLASARAAGYAIEGCNVGVGGTGVTQLLDPASGSSNKDLFLRASAFYNALRRKNIMVIALGTNDLANGNPTAYVLNGTAPPSNTGSGLFPAIDAAVAQGWKVLVITPGPRTDTMGVTQAAYNAARTTVCDALVAGATAHGYAILDTRPITNYGGPTDSDNATYYSGDKVHPIDAGHALIAPYVYSAVAALLSA